MRFEQLSLRVSGEELSLRFHSRVTVLSGLGAPERQALIDSLLGALDGRETGSSLSYVDSLGQRVTIRTHDDGRVTSEYDDGTAARFQSYSTSSSDPHFGQALSTSPTSNVAAHAGALISRCWAPFWAWDIWPKRPCFRWRCS